MPTEIAKLTKVYESLPGALSQDIVSLRGEGSGVECEIGEGSKGRVCPLWKKSWFLGLQMINSAMFVPQTKKFIVIIF